VIKKILHKGLKKFYQTGSASGVQPAHKRRLQLILARLDASHKPEDMNLPGFDFHPLIGELKGYYSVSVNKNWRILFKFEGVDAIDVDYKDYH
jgi:proteic killer suppression protein